MKAARIVVLGMALTAGGLAALLAGRSDKAPAPAPEPVAKVETADVLVAQGDIGVGHRLTAQNLQWQAWPASAVGPQLIRKSERHNAIDDLVGSIVRTSFVAGEPIREAKLIAAKGSGYLAALLPPGMRAVSTEISPETGVAGFILPNDRVDVILTRAEKTNQDEVYTTEIVLSNVQVLAIDQTLEEKTGQKAVTGKLATLALSPRQAQTLALARRLGTLSLALRSIDARDQSSSEEGDNLGRRETINMVRFGRSSTVLK
jgi:pilus assembly protein CpaB